MKTPFSNREQLESPDPRISYPAFISMSKLGVVKRLVLSINFGMKDLRYFAIKATPNPSI